jgi:hypothetical protein
MARLVEIISTVTGKHYVLIGYDSQELSSFKLQMWIHKTGVRMTDWCQSLGLNFCTFMGGDIWIHNDENQDRCNLFDEKRDCVVGVMANEQPGTVKIYDSMGVQSDHQWEVTSVVIPPTLNYPDGMESKIPTAQFKRRQGLWRAKFLRNMKSSSGTASTLDAIRGEELRGQTMYMTLKNTSNDQVKLFMIEVNETTSRI